MSRALRHKQAVRSHLEAGRQTTEIDVHLFGVPIGNFCDGSVDLSRVLVLLTRQLDARSVARRSATNKKGEGTCPRNDPASFHRTLQMFPLRGGSLAWHTVSGVEGDLFCIVERLRSPDP